MELHGFWLLCERFDDWSWEQRVIHYAGKLCLGSRVISLAERKLTCAFGILNSSRTGVISSPLSEHCNVLSSIGSARAPS